MKTVPEGYHFVNSFLIVEGVPKLIQFLKQTFDAEVEEWVKGSDGRIAHAELTIGDSIIMMMADATPKYDAVASHLYVYIENVEMTFKRALEAGASLVQETADQFYGDRTAWFKEPTGNFWRIAQHVEEVPAEELERCLKARSIH